MSQPPRRRAARPVAGAPVEALLARTEDVAKAWVIALIEDAPLAQSAAIVTAGWVGESAAVCAAVIRALREQDALRELPAVSLELRAIGALEEVVWAALREELPRADAELLGDLAERLRSVVESLRAGAAAAAEPWLAPLERELAGRLGAALVLVVLDDAERILDGELLDGFHEAVRSVAAGAVSDQPGRAWVVARDAAATAERIAEAVRSRVTWGGAPMTVSAGIARPGADGSTAAELIAVAEERAFEAAASGRSPVG